MEYLWLTDQANVIDSYLGFRGTFCLEAESELTIKILEAHCFEAWLDDKFLCEGPARFDLDHPNMKRLLSGMQSNLQQEKSQANPLRFWPL